MKKPFLLSAIIISALTIARAQSGTNSPYSQYGLGKLGDQSIGLSRGMNGVGIGFREKGHVNYLNPASYSSIDSLTFIFDIGMSLQNTNFKEGSTKKNAKNGDFEYAVANFRLVRHVGMAFGILPYTNVGYNYSSKPEIIKDYTQLPSTSTTTTRTNSYYGKGGLHQVFLGAGWEPIPNLSVGMNINYLFGNITNQIENTYSDGYIKSTKKNYEIQVNSIKLDFGIDYTLQLKNRNSVTVGLTYSPGFKISDANCNVISENVASNIRGTANYTAIGGAQTPTQWGIGLGYKHDTKWLVGLDYTFQNWGSIDRIPYTTLDGASITNYTDGYNNRHKINFGGQYCKNTLGRTFADRICYRFGMGYSSSYLKINDQDGPSEFSVSAGVGLPIQNSMKRSYINIGLQWSRASAKNLITENTILLNIGLTFNERWFAKWKFE